MALWLFDTKGYVCIPSTNKIATPKYECVLVDPADTNEYEMLSQSKISAYGDASRYIDSFKKGDYALFYSKGRGIIAIGRITSDKVCTAENEKYHEVNLILPKKFSGNVEELPSLTPTEIRAALNRNFYWASTIKTPFLDNNQVNILISELAKKYEETTRS